MQSLPSAEEYERLKEKRQKELMREIEAQRQAELEAKRIAARMDEVREGEGRKKWVVGETRVLMREMCGVRELL